MIVNIKDLVGEICVVNGLGNVRLGGALPEGRTFASAYTNGTNLIPVKIEELDNQKNVIWFEYSLCTFNSILNELVRNTVRQSSNNNNPVVFGPRQKRAFVFVPGEDLSIVALSGNYSDLIGAPSSAGGAVLITAQSLLTAEQTQARTNIKAAERLVPFLFPGALMTWTIVHNLGRPLPPFRVLDSAGEQMIVSAEDQVGFNTTIINFNSPQSGGVYFN